MEILRNLTKKMEIRDRGFLNQKVSELKRCFSEPGIPLKVATFCDPLSKRACITLCGSGRGADCGSEEVREAVLEGIARAGIEISVGNMKTGCAGSCNQGPIMGFPQRQFFYVGIKAADVPRILDETIMRGKLLFPFLSIDSARSYRSDIFYDKSTGFLAAIDEKVCMVDTAKYFLDFEDTLSCGKCVPCRIGMKRAHECITRISAGEGTEEDLDQIRSLCMVMKQTPNCEFAFTSIKPLQSALSCFEAEFRAHIDRKECSAGVCKELVAYQRKLAVRERLGQKAK
ncbi:MAG: NADH-ubiquinone oxidoreductase-F iron-sulfur binding region domain-containing protein [Syntrophobacteraceae bacterium]